MTYATSWRDAVPRPATARKRARAAARRLVLSGLACLSPRPRRPRPFLRFTYGHHVFADERAQFERTLGALRDTGVAFIAADRALAMLEGREPVDGAYLHLTFDDGFANVVRHALPILERLGAPATLFVPSAFVGADADGARRFGVGIARYRAPVEMATWAELRAAADAGLVEVGSHTRTHARLSEISGNPARLQDEVAGSKAEIEERMGRPCRYFSGPFGQRTDMDERTVGAVRAAGYEALFWAYRGPVRPGVTSRWHIPRGHFEAHWPLAHVLYFARGGMEGRDAAA